MASGGLANLDALEGIAEGPTLAGSGVPLNFSETSMADARPPKQAAPRIGKSASRGGFAPAGVHWAEFRRDAKYLDPSVAVAARTAVISGRLPTIERAVMTRLRPSRAMLHLLTGALIDGAHSAGRDGASVQEVRDLYEAWAAVLFRHGLSDAFGGAVWHITACLKLAERPNLVDSVEADVIHKSSDPGWGNPWMVRSGANAAPDRPDPRRLDGPAVSIVYGLPVDGIWPAIELVRGLGGRRQLMSLAQGETRPAELGRGLQEGAWAAELARQAADFDCADLARRMAYAADLMFEWGVFALETYRRQEPIFGGAPLATLKSAWPRFREIAEGDLVACGRILPSRLSPMESGARAGMR